MGHGICICNNEKVTYIYLCGINPIRNIKLSERMTLMPVVSSPSPDDMIDCVMKNGNGSEFELGILISTLRHTTAMIKIGCNDAQELACLAWNSQAIGVLIGALLKCEVSWYFQASKPANEFDAVTRVSMIYSNMYKFPSNLVTIDEQQCLILENSIPIALNLNEDNRFANAANALWGYRWNPRPAVQLSVIWGGIESLFLIERGIKSKLSTAASRFLSGTDELVGEIRLLYETRCKAVHELNNGENEMLQASAELLYRLIIRCVELNNIPNVAELLP